jgi:hypothetical protein
MAVLIQVERKHNSADQVFLDVPRLRRHDPGDPGVGRHPRAKACFALSECQSRAGASDSSELGTKFVR